MCWDFSASRYDIALNKYGVRSLPLAMFYRACLVGILLLGLPQLSHAASATLLWDHSQIRTLRVILSPTAPKQAITERFYGSVTSTRSRCRIWQSGKRTT